MVRHRRSGRAAPPGLLLFPFQDVDMAPFELADIRIGLFPVQFPGLHTFGRIYKHRAVLDGGYKGGRTGDFWRDNHHLSVGNGGYTRKPCNQGAEKIKVEQA